MKRFYYLVQNLEGDRNILIESSTAMTMVEIEIEVFEKYGIHSDDLYHHGRLDGFETLKLS